MSESLNRLQGFEVEPNWITPNIETEFIELIQKMYNGELNNEQVSDIVLMLINRKFIN